MDLKEAQALIKAITDKDLPAQQFVDDASAQRVAQAYSLVLGSEYVAIKRGYAYRVEPREGAVQLVIRKPDPKDRR
jgi:hypothetical protein